MLLTGERNLCFLPESQRRMFAHLERHAPGRHALHVLPDHSHLDVFLGRDAARDVFPLILRELDPVVRRPWRSGRPRPGPPRSWS